MKKTVLALVLCLAAILSATGARASSLTYFRLISVYYQSGSTTVSAGGLIIEDLTGNNPPTFAGGIYISTQAGTDSGSGTMDVVLDPLGNIGRLSGTVAGSFGNLTADFVFTGTQMNTAIPPYVGADISPTPYVSAQFFWNRFGHAVGSATFAFGTVNVPDSGALAATGLGLYAA